MLYGFIVFKCKRHRKVETQLLTQNYIYEWKFDHRYLKISIDKYTCCGIYNKASANLDRLMVFAMLFHMIMEKKTCRYKCSKHKLRIKVKRCQLYHIII